MQAIKELAAFCWAVLEIAYEPTKDDPLSIPGVHTVPEKGYVTGGLKVHDAKVYRLYEQMVKEIEEFVEYIRRKYTRLMWQTFEMDKRICEKCGTTFVGLEGQKECFVCRRGE